MSTPQGKTPFEKYISALDSLNKKQERYEKMIKKDGPGAEKLLKDIAKLNEELPDLDKKKHEDVLSKSCQSYLVKTYALEKYNRVRDVETKEMVKGIVVEDDSIHMFSKVEGTLYEKNKTRLYNEYITGLPDLFDGESLENASRVIDIKSCWDIETFLKHVTEPMSSSHYWQLQGYLWLTNARTGVIAYCLTNTPESIINKEKERLLWKLDVATEENPLFKKEAEKLERNMRFDDIPFQERVIRVEVDRNDDDIEKIEKKVLKCREYLTEFQEKHLQFTKNYRKERFYEEVNTEEAE